MREYKHSIKQVGKKCQKKVCARREVPPPLCTNRAKYNTSTAGTVQRKID